MSRALLSPLAILSQALIEVEHLQVFELLHFLVELVAKLVLVHFLLEALPLHLLAVHLSLRPIYWKVPLQLTEMSMSDLHEL
jgi:hypothetical protein